MTKWSKARFWIMTISIAFLIGITSLGYVQNWELRACAEPNSLPFSNKQSEGFENRIAEIIAHELGAQLSYAWLPQPYSRARNVFIQEGRCDIVIGIPDGHSGFLTSLAYYRTTFVFVYRKNSQYDIDSFNDPDMKGLKIGVQTSGGSMSPAHYALAKRGLVGNQVGFSPNFSQPNPFARIVRAVAEGEVDVAVVWGPIAGYFAKETFTELELVSVSPQIETPFIPMIAPISIGMRLGDEALRDRLNVALTRRWDEIQAVLEEYGVPLEPLPKPSLETEGFLELRRFSGYQH